ncbi:hypothetical protein TWF191_006745 [Orbilia oligospora]|uniref:ATP-grasp domain-containing protein n=1 Tax=Orbilia oligospora TaxID=2813651 RepID=A0A7C8R233_ORBOL|nr:hypothetical protein TWF191_006745 [Orbilia oligospora]
MKICCLHSSDEGIEAGEEDPEDIWQDPGLFTTQHTFENKYIVKATAKAQIDEAIAEGYDFYLVFMWGTRDDAIAGFEAIKYFESLNLPSAGVRSFERARDKFDFFADAKRLGNLPIPGDEKFPLFVKPAADYASKLIDENSLVRNEAELEATISRLNPRMRAQRLRRAEALGEKDPEEYVKSLEKAGRDAKDLVIQEFIDGDEFSVVVLAMGYVPVALTPLVVKYGKKQNEAEQFLTFEVKYHEGSGYGLLDEEKDPGLYKELQAVAVKAFEETGAQPSYMGCEVDFRVRRSDKKPFIIEVDPMPVWFFPTGSSSEETIELCRQGGCYGDLIHKETVPFLAHYNQRVDHILLLSETESLSVEELDFVLARCFQLANHSITVFSPEKTDAASNIKSFGEPRNWRLTYNKAFTAHSLKAGTTITAFRFERTAKPVQFMAEARD